MTDRWHPWGMGDRAKIIARRTAEGEPLNTGSIVRVCGSDLEGPEPIVVICAEGDFDAYATPGPVKEGRRCYVVHPNDIKPVPEQA